MTRRQIIAIDGAAGSGKSTVGKGLALALGYEYVDTGAMYRAVGLEVAARPEPERALAEAGRIAAESQIETSWHPSEGRFEVRIAGRDVSRDVRLPEAALWASKVAAIPAVREVLVRLQRAKGEAIGAADDRETTAAGVVMEGRDIGTAVFPKADHKFFLEADSAERARRRQRDEGRDEGVVRRDLDDRDARDVSRQVSPLKPADDAVRVDTTTLSSDQVIAQLLDHIRRRR